jgi:hypothetical protein
MITKAVWPHVFLAEDLAHQTIAPCLAAVVFSQFTSFLTIVEAALAEAGFATCRIDGAVAAAVRKQRLVAFQQEGGPRVMLVSLRAGGTGMLHRAFAYVHCASLCYHGS